MNWWSPGRPPSGECRSPSRDVPLPSADGGVRRSMKLDRFSADLEVVGWIVGVLAVLLERFALRLPLRLQILLHGFGLFLVGLPGGARGRALGVGLSGGRRRATDARDGQHNYGGVFVHGSF